jgi:hypothetical protein
MSITLTDGSMVQPDQYHLPFITDIKFSFENSIKTHDYSYRRFYSWDYSLLHNLYKYDWSCVYSAATVDAVTDSPNAAVHLATDQAIPRHYMKNKSYYYYKLLFY